MRALRGYAAARVGGRAGGAVALQAMTATPKLKTGKAKMLVVSATLEEIFHGKLKKVQHTRKVRRPAPALAFALATRPPARCDHKQRDVWATSTLDVAWITRALRDVV